MARWRFGKLLRELREDRGYAQERLATELTRWGYPGGISQRTVSEYEKVRHPIRGEFFAGLYAVLRLNEEEDRALY